MARMRRLKKGTTPPSVGGGGKKVKEKCIYKNQRRDKASKGVGVNCGTIILSTRHQPYMTDTETMDAAAYGVKNQDRPPLPEGDVKERSYKGEYNRFTISPFCEEDISATVFNHFTM